jgi:hypothetical protein
LGGILVQLLNSAGTQVLDSVTSTSSGAYQFTVAAGTSDAVGLPEQLNSQAMERAMRVGGFDPTVTDLSAASTVEAQTYRIRFLTQLGLNYAPANQGGNDALDSDALAPNGITDPITVNPGQNNDTVDAGFTNIQATPTSTATATATTTPTATATVGTGTITGTIFDDVNRNGLREGGEAALPNITLELLNGSTSALIATRQTNSSGVYSFTVPAGPYLVRLVTPVGLGITQPAAGGSVFDPATRLSPLQNLTAGTTIANVDGGLASLVTPTPTATLGGLGTIAGTIFSDANRNSQRDPGEAGAAYVNIDLLDTGGTVLDSTLTSAGGAYSFTVPPGSYQVRLNTPFARTISAQSAGSVFDPATGLTPVLNVNAGQTTGNINGALSPAPLTPDDYFSILRNNSLTVGDEENLLRNDGGATTAQLVSGPSNGTLTLNPNGTFNYSPNTDFEGVDQFVYQASGNGVSLNATVRISVANISVTDPPDQTTPAGTPIPIPGLSVSSTDPQVTVNLNVGNGTLNVTGGITASNSRLRNVAKPAMQGAAVVGGNGTGNITVTGNINDVNAVLSTLVYQPNAGFVGVDTLVIVANSPTITITAVAQVNISVTGGGGGTVVPGTPGGTPQATQVVGSLATPTPILGVPVLLRQIGTTTGGLAPPIIGEVAPGTVNNGDVFIRLLVVDGRYLTAPSELGDPSLVRRPVIQATEVFGLTFGGASIARFNINVRICLRGTGVFYYRDATIAPRSTVTLQSTPDNIYTCAVIPNAGTVILIDELGASGITPLPPPPSAPGTTVSLSDCMATTTAIVNLRSGPSTNDGVLVQMPFGVTLTALRRSGDWLELDFLGTVGWANANFLTLDGACG